MCRRQIAVYTKCVKGLIIRRYFWLLLVVVAILKARQNKSTSLKIPPGKLGRVVTYLHLIELVNK